MTKKPSEDVDEIVRVAVVDPDTNTVLLLKRDGKYELPGGKVCDKPKKLREFVDLPKKERREQRAEALAQEIAEEIGWVIKPRKLEYVTDNWVDAKEKSPVSKTVERHVTLYKLVLKKGERKEIEKKVKKHESTEGHEGHRWVPLSEFPKLEKTRTTSQVKSKVAKQLRS